MSQFMNTLQHLALCITAEILCIIGVLINAFIVAVTLTRRLKGEDGTHVDHLITILGMTRIGSEVASIICILLDVFFHNQNLSLILYVINKLDSFFSHASSWIMTLLSVVFCLKISNFHHVFLLRLKITISRKFVHLIAILALVSLCYILLPCWVELIEFPKYMAHNMTTTSTGTPQRSILLMVIFLVGNAVPFILYCTSSLLLVTSLSFHINQMRLNKTPNSNLDKYCKIIKFVTLSLIYYMINATACVGVLYSHYFYSLNIIWVYITIDIFPILHSIYLIQRTKKLKDNFYKIFQHGVSCLLNSQTEDLTSGDPVEIVMK
ncbi:taste receptor type 2 member 4-like [Leptodactylus fuscus]|uniref:taste receptor type 2 member 4-like n=1 Tax=Leptodactylus fuscus TaxID=238119 RepID=UPI003F4E56A7